MVLVKKMPETQNLKLSIEHNPDWPGSSKIIRGIHAGIITLLIGMHMLVMAIRSYRNVITAGKVLQMLVREKRRVFGDSILTRYVKVGNRYYWSFMTAGWPSPAFTRFIENEFMRVRPFANRTNHLQLLILAITSKCGLSCEHCYEWDKLDSREALDIAQLKRVIHDFQYRGVSQIHLSGGEPLNRFNGMLELLRTAKPWTDFWLLTSGFGLNLEKAKQLKQAGLTGVIVSLDHWKEKAHNQFRRNDKSFYWVREAVLNCHRVGLPTSLSLCATKEFISRDNLWTYFRLAKRMGVGFVRILEPRQVGRYAHSDVELSEEHWEQLRQFYLSANSNPRYRDWPIVAYHGFHQHQYGCFGAGERFLYVDSKGEMQACPFCHNSAGKVVSTPIDELIKRMQSGAGCFQFNQMRQGI